MPDFIPELNERVKLKLGASSIHGVGVVAARDIKAGEKLYADNVPVVYKLSSDNLSKLIPSVLTQLVDRWPRMTLGDAFIYPDAVLSAYLNHANEPNYDNASDLALTDIKAGEEITEDYRTIEGWDSVYPWLVDSERKRTVSVKE